MSSGTIAAKGRRAGQSPWVERLGRAGLVAKGVVYIVVGILAVKVALGGRTESPDRQGALDAIAQQPFGRGLLVVLALGLAGYAIWRLAQGFLDRDNEGEDAKGLAKRGGAIARAAWYGLLAVLTFDRVLGRSSGGGSNEQKTTAGVFDLPLGRYLVYAAGLAFIGAAAFNGYRAVTCKFNKKLKTGEMNDAEETAATGVGILGPLARMVVFGLIWPPPAPGRLEVRPEEGTWPRRRAARALAAAVRRAAARRSRRRADRLRALLLRPGALPPDLAR